MTQTRRIIDCRPGLEGKVAFVTGGFGGIGHECIHALMAHGVNVAFTYTVGPDKVARAQRFVDQQPEQLSAHVMDLRSWSSIQEALSEAMARWGRLDILVNNAGVGSATVAKFEENETDQDTAMLLINADGTLKVCQAYLSLMDHAIKSDSLKIINLGSVGGGLQAFPAFRHSDTMSKAAVAHLTRQLAAQLTDTMVDVFAVNPGATNTKMLQASVLDKMSQEQRLAFAASLPKGRLIEPREIADIIVFLASGYSTPLHGAIIDASMGLGVRPGLITES